ncbi:50S ribosomal protein L13 [Patescibacteria group bacterium]
MQRKTHTIDVKDKVLGRIATQVAILLMGKNKPTYQPHLDEGDSVIIKNVDKMKFTGKKITDKVYKHHTGYIGNLKITKMGELYNKNPEKVFNKAVYNMLPKNKLRKERMKRINFE